MANKTIQWECHPTPTNDELVHVMNGAKVSLKLDLRAGYHQLTLAEESHHEICQAQRSTMLQQATFWHKHSL